MPSANHSKKGGIIASYEETHYKWLVLNVMPPSEVESQGRDIHNKIASLLTYNDDGVSLKYSSCMVFVGKWYKKALSSKKSKSLLIECNGKTWQLSIVKKTPKKVKEVNMAMDRDVRKLVMIMMLKVKQ